MFQIHCFLCGVPVLFWSMDLVLQVELRTISSTSTCSGAFFRNVLALCSTISAIPPRSGRPSTVIPWSDHAQSNTKKQRELHLRPYKSISAQLEEDYGVPKRKWAKKPKRKVTVVHQIISCRHQKHFVLRSASSLVYNL